jgi:hypothetical protein
VRTGEGERGGAIRDSAVEAVVNVVNDSVDASVVSKSWCKMFLLTNGLNAFNVMSCFGIAAAWCRMRKNMCTFSASDSLLASEKCIERANGTKNNKKSL